MSTGLTRLRQRLTRREVVGSAILLALSVCLAAGIWLWRPAKAETRYDRRIAEWTVSDISGSRMFLGLGSFIYRANWAGPAQQFAGPVLLQVSETDVPVQFSFDGPVSVARDGEQTLTTEGAGSPQPGGTTVGISLGLNDLVAIPANTRFSVTTGDDQVARLTAVALLPSGPPQTEGIEQVEWRAWGIVNPAPEGPLTIALDDISLDGGASYRFQRTNGPALVYVEGIGDGGQSIALALSRGRGAYMRVNDFAAYDLVTPVSFLAVQTPLTLNRERTFDARGGAFIISGSAGTLRNRSLVDGTNLLMITVDGPNPVPLPTSTPSPTPRPDPTPLRGTPTRTPTVQPGDGSN